MIDLNDLLKNIDTYKERYAKKGLKVNLDYFVFAEEARKKLQLDTEKLRALCNKLCGEVPKFREKNQDTAELIKQITLIDLVIKENIKVLEKYNKAINKKLRKLHNLPEFDNQFNEQIITRKTSDLTLATLEQLIVQNTKVIYHKGSIKNYLKSNRNMLFSEEKMPIVVRANDGYTFLCNEADVSRIQKLFYDFFYENSLSMIRVSSRRMNRANTESFFMHLNKREACFFEINKQFYTREYNVKYRSRDIDMTKFVNQLNIMLKW